MAGDRSRWLGPKKQPTQHLRVTVDRMVDDGRWVRQSNDSWRFETDNVTERVWVARRAEGEGWNHGAKVYRKAA